MTLTPLSRILTITAVVALALGGTSARAATIWQEGEDPAESNMHGHPWYDKVKADELSGGKWLSNFDADHVGTATYRIEVPETGRYTFWVRANPVASRLSYRLDGGDWELISMGEAMDRRNIAADDHVDIRFIGWKRVGDLRLDAGRHTIAFRMDSTNNNHGGLDAFLLTTEGFNPSGKAKPGEAGTEVGDFGGEGTWAFTPPVDEFTDEAVLDLRSLNEDRAGETGFIGVSEDGMSFVKGDGTPIRFWAVVSGGHNKGPGDMERHCRFLAKHGVNMVRLHVNLCVTDEGAQITDVNEKLIDNIQRFISIARDHGIYATISPYWAHAKAPASWGLEGVEGKSPWGVLFFNERFQEAYKTWIKELYTRPNPYTGVPLKDEPAVGIIQVKNEDSMFFFTMPRLPEPQKRILGAQFGDWLKDKYGSLAAARRAWSGNTHEGDDFEAGVVGILDTWHLTQPARGGQAVRIEDQLRFFAHTQYGFYEEIDTYLRETLGCRQLTNAMNWKSGDKLTLDDIERWTYTACDVIAVNRYTGGRHIGQNRGYRIDPGHQFTNRSMTRHPLQLPTNLKQVVGHPMIITESSWVHPNLYQSEGPFLAAAYQSLTGVDTFYWFHAGATTWLRDPRRMFWKVGDSYALDKWSCSTPELIGMFPANAIAYRLGYLRQGETVVHEERTLDALFERKTPIIAETASFDPNRDAEDFTDRSPVKQEVDRLAFLVGPVQAKFEGNPSETYVADLERYIDRDAQVVRANTGEIELDYGRGVCRVDSPRAQGVAGFLADAGGRFELGDVTVESGNDYAVVSVVSMDGEALASSGSILVQVGTVARPTGWQEKDVEIREGEETFEGKEIVNTGRPPWQITNTDVTLTVANPAVTLAVLLDTAGYVDREVPVERSGDSVTVHLPPETMYLILQR